MAGRGGIKGRGGGGGGAVSCDIEIRVGWLRLAGGLPCGKLGMSIGEG